MAQGITKRGDRQWFVRVRRGGHTVSRTLDSYADAEAFRAKTIAQIDGGTYRDHERERNTTLLDAIDFYEREILPTKRGARQEASRLKAWKGQPWAKLPVGSVTAEDHIAPWIKSRQREGVGASTIRNALAVLSVVFKTAKKRLHLDIRNPVENVQRPAAPPPRRVKLGAKDMAALLTACGEGPPYLIHCVRLAIETAMRQGEIRRLRWEHVYETHIHLPRTKNGDVRDVPLTEEASVIIEEIRRTLPDRDGWMFGNPELAGSAGGFTEDMVQSAYNDAVTRAMDRHGLSTRLTFHDLRHVAITALKQDHADAMDLAKTTGHKTLSLLHKVYYEPDPAERAADIRRRRAERKSREAV